MTGFMSLFGSVEEAVRTLTPDPDDADEIVRQVTAAPVPRGPLVVAGLCRLVLDADGAVTLVPMVLVETDAPPTYDGFGTRTVRETGEATGLGRVRIVQADPNHVEWQTGRYGSGGYFARGSRHEFDARWHAEAAAGRCDGFGGAEYRRKLAAWERAGCPVAMRDFIVS